MTITERSVADAVSDALSWQADSRNRVSEPPPSAEDTYKEAARSLGSPGAAVAVATLATTGWAPTPLGDDQPPSAAPLSTYQAVYEHFRGRHHDGAGLELGPKPGGVTLVAQRGSAAGWQAWQKVVGAEVSRRVDDYGRTVEVATPLPLCRFVSLTWQPPPSPFRSSGVQLGREALAHAGRALGPDSAPAEPGWLLFATAPVDGRSLSFKDRKPDRHGVAVQASGIVPLYARRTDGTTCTASGIPMAEPVPGWLVEALGGRWGRS